MVFPLSVPELEGALVRLEPLSQGHAPDLAAAVSLDRSSYGFTWVPAADEVEQYIAAQLERADTGGLAPFAQIAVSTGRAVGATAYWDPRLWTHNARSRSALAGVGARFEGVLRNWSKSWAPGETGLLRDSAMFSVIAEEWPECRSKLRARLATFAR